MGDLEELFQRRAALDGAAPARRWYWRQSASFSTRFLAERLRERQRTADMSTGFSWIDFRLALRMLVRYPGLTLVGVFGMAVGIAIATGAFTIVFSMMDPVVSLEEGDRVVSIVNWDASTNNREQRSLHDFAAWRELQSVEDIGAVRTVGRNLIAPGGQPETVTLAEMTASGFTVARVSPMLGRYILPEDERAGAPEVVVIGHDVWVRRFSADPGIIGRPLQLGATTHTIIGVMPEGFGFPVSHSFWVPWRLDPSAYGPRTGPQITVFARLAPGATLESAQAELNAVTRRTADASPATHEHLRARVLPYTYAYTDMDDPDNALALHAIQIAILMLLVVVCVNVAILVYARTATRQGEIAVRTALGASRRRIVAQLFVEALVLAGVSAVVGIGLVAVAFRHLDSAFLQVAGPLPFWIDLGLSAEAALYVVALTVLAAGIVGIVPALKATGRRVQTGLQGLSSGSGSRMQMGRLWTLLIVAQVAFTVALLPATIFHTWNSLRFRTGDSGFASQEVLTTRLVMDRGSSELPTEASERQFRQRYAGQQAELERRLEAEPAVSDVTFSLVNPGEELALVAEIEGVPAPIDPLDYNIVEGSKRGHLVRFNRVATDYFDAFAVDLVMGRGFGAGDVEGAPGRSASGSQESPESSVHGILVNRTFADVMFGGESPLGRRIRYVGRSREAPAKDVALNRWYEIVGVVQNFPTAKTLDARPVSRLYHATAPGDVYPGMLAVRVRGMAPSTFAGRLRELSAAVDPLLQLRDVASAEDISKREQGLMRIIGLTLAVVMLSVVILSAAGIYALMSFTVARRRREIGIRAALGADPAQILTSIFSRAFAQLAAGAAIGLAGAFALEQVLEGEMFQGQGAVLLPIVAVFMTTVGLLSALGPARRGLRIQPTEALRED